MAPREAAAAAGHLHVLLVIEAAGGGAGRHVLDLARGLLGCGHGVDLVWSPRRAEAGFLAALAGIPGLRSHPLPMTRAPGPGDLAAVMALRRLIKHAGPFDLIHGHSSKAGALVRLATAGLGLPALYTPHAFVTLDPGLGAMRRTGYRMTERILARLGSRIICVSEDERDHALALGIPAPRLAVIANGISALQPADQAGARAQLGLRPESPCVGFVGRLSVQKSVDRLIRAFARVPGQEGARLVIVGEGPERTALESLSRELGVVDRTLFTGQADGPVLMSAFDVFALPSRYEGFPYVLLEAAGRGLPIVTMAVGGAGIVVAEGWNGFIVPQGDDPAPLARKLGTLLSDATLRRVMGQRSVERAAGLTVEKMVERTVAVYREALG